jgi:hypothetical protein
MQEKELVELGYEAIQFTSGQERTVLRPRRALVLIGVAFISHDDHASRNDRRAREPHLVLKGDASNLRVRHPSSVPKVIIQCLCTRARKTVQKVHFLYARAIWCYEQLIIELLDESCRHLFIVCGDDEDPVDDLLECTVPVGRPECSPLGTSITEELGILLLPPDIRIVAQAIVEPEELHSQVGKADVDPKEGVIICFGFAGVNTGWRTVYQVVSSVDLREDEFLENLAEVRKVFDSEIIKVFEGLWQSWSV